MTTIYEYHDQAFAHVSAYVIAKDGERVATIAFKFPRDGAGRLYVYVHWFGCEMVRGQARGYGYNKTDAAVSDAGRVYQAKRAKAGEREIDLAHTSGFDAFLAALDIDDGYNWDRHLRDAGFDVWQAV